MDHNASISTIISQQLRPDLFKFWLADFISFVTYSSFLVSSKMVTDGNECFCEAIDILIPI